MRSQLVCPNSLPKFANIKSFRLSAAGDIRVFIEHTLTPLIEYKDPNPLKITHFGFTSYGQSLARFYYNCRGDEIYTPTQLAQRCEQTSTSDLEHTHFVPIGANAAESSDHVVNLPIFVAAKQDAHILISSDNSSLDHIRNGYEIGEAYQFHFVAWLVDFDGNICVFSYW